eukprot:GEMP01007111.1.p1 GENE.GEMP01007111.1~~GEMP01007111.1.p1  ORF type:complete len:620 (+),score=123.95 GEMP01007111.1:40-1899(+)
MVSGVFPIEMQKSDNACPLLAPMWCVPLTTLLRMTSVESHEELMRRDELVMHNPGDDAPVMFISHQWLSPIHPDPGNCQLYVLQKAILNLLTGKDVCNSAKSSVNLCMKRGNHRWAHLLANARVWYDFFSIPQAEGRSTDMDLSIQSIPAYLKLSTFGFVLVPTLECQSHEDTQTVNYHSWQGRGWCRLENFFMEMYSLTPVVIESEDVIYFQPYIMGVSLCAIADGKFSCCEAGHIVRRPDGTTVPLQCDKTKLASVVDSIIKRRLADAMNGERKDVELMRKLQAFSRLWQVGLHERADKEMAHSTRKCSVDEFLAVYHFASPYGQYGGWTPLRCACISGNVGVVAELLKDPRVDVEAVFGTSSAIFAARKCMNILAHLCLICRLPEHVHILDLLLSAKANPTPAGSFDALTYACAAPHPHKYGVRWFLRTFPSHNVNAICVDYTRIVSLWPTYTCAVNSDDIGTLRLLVEHKADLTFQGTWYPTDTFLALCGNSAVTSPETLDYVYRVIRQQQRVFDINRQLWMPWWFTIFAQLLLTLRLGPVGFIHLLLSRHGATGLILAAFAGNSRIVDWLLDNDADPSIVNANGATALTVARERGFTHVEKILQNHRNNIFRSL